MMIARERVTERDSSRRTAKGVRRTERRSSVRPNAVRHKPHPVLPFPYAVSRTPYAGITFARMSELRRSLGLPYATAMVVGTIIGASIFVQPSEITRQMPSVTGIILVWIAAGCLTTFG